ncbi:MAG: hypothetical protein HFE86_06875 [Clostridiales bacterium]|nr:hypothetical protein [Clostridiales bacterium]
MKRLQGKQIFSVLLGLLLLTGAAGCQPADKDTAGTLYVESGSLSSQNVVPETPELVSSPATSAAPAMSSDTVSVRKSFMQSLRTTNELPSFKRSVTRVLRVGEVELMRASESLQSADKAGSPVQLSVLQASYKTETAGSMGLQDVSTYLENGRLHTVTTLEDSKDAANNRSNAVAAPREGAEAAPAVPDFYLQLTDKMISSADISQNGSDILYSFTLDPEASRTQILELLEGQTDRLDFDLLAFALDYNICTARSNADGFIVELTSSIGGRYTTEGENRNGELSVKYAFSQLGTAQPPDQPKWLSE